MSRNYVNNKEFYNALVEYRKVCEEAEESGDDLPIIPDYIGECIYEIANRLSHRENFINYSFRDDMVSDGIENAIGSVLKFDPNMSKNPFAYFTQIIWFAFIRRIQAEQKQVYVRHKVIENSMIMKTAVEKTNTGTNVDAFYIDLDNDYISDFVENYEEKIKKKRERAKERAEEAKELKG